MLKLIRQFLLGCGIVMKKRLLQFHPRYYSPDEERRQFIRLVVDLVGSTLQYNVLVILVGKAATIYFLLR